METKTMLQVYGEKLTTRMQERGFSNSTFEQVIIALFGLPKEEGVNFLQTLLEATETAKDDKEFRAKIWETEELLSKE